MMANNPLSNLLVHTKTRGRILFSAWTYISLHNTYEDAWNSVNNELIKVEQNHGKRNI